MVKHSLWLLLLWPLMASVPEGHAQQATPVIGDSLTIEAIMREPSWMGHSPQGIQWSPESDQVFFRWNPNPTTGDSLYSYELKHKELLPVTPETRQVMPTGIVYGPEKRRGVFEKDGDIFLINLRNGESRNITHTSFPEMQPSISQDGNQVFFISRHNYFSLNLKSGELQQLTDFRPGSAQSNSAQAQLDFRDWLSNQERQLISTLSASEGKTPPKESRPTPYYCGNQQIDHLTISPDGRFVTMLFRESPSGNFTTQVPRYITPTGFPEVIQARPKVGSPQPHYELATYDVERDTVITISIEQLPGIMAPLDLGDNLVATRSEGEEDAESAPVAMAPREVIFMKPLWPSAGEHALLEVRTLDFKDRWIMLLEPSTGSMTLLDHQHDDAWIDGPGIGRWLGSTSQMGWMPDNEWIWYTSEATGYANLYLVSALTGQTRALTRGPYEVDRIQPSQDGEHLYFSSNLTHPGEWHYYRVPAAGGQPEQLTAQPGWNEVTLSPDEKYLAIRYSNPNTPWELYIQKNKPGAAPERITQSLSQEFQRYPWRNPEHHVIEARDGGNIHARLYRPDSLTKDGPAVIFVHGAGYLQNAHKGWSDYFREYMFHNLLADHGYIVLDLDFRGSAGYGRDWRTDVYRHMGGKDLDDQVDAAKWLVDAWEISPERIGIYGGSYGGFITLMAMFTQPGVFACGAALRPVTDWAHYNHPYTAPMLNTPEKDSVAYQQSSPIYHAEGLEGSLLICHGMIDTNVHFQDVVRLSQRLIELGKDNWDVAFYPMEGHAFKHASSWTDEYRRIFELFERELK